MDSLLKIAVEAGATGIAIVALFIFHKMIQEHRKERQEDSAEWRRTIATNGERTEKVLVDLMNTIKTKS